MAKSGTSLIPSTEQDADPPLNSDKAARVFHGIYNTEEE
jgi:hypothetical protein